MVLIAHPPFLFGDSETASGPLLLIDGGEKGTAAERLLAVGYTLRPFRSPHAAHCVNILFSGALLGVAGTVGTCKSFHNLYSMAMI